MITLAFGIAATGVYLWAAAEYARRYPARALPVWRIAAYVTGAAVMTAALLPPADALADSSFSAHMLQHMALLLVGPPLVLLGAPLLLSVSLPPAGTARKITGFANGSFGHALFAPVTAWLFFVCVLWGAHFSPLYEAALDSPGVHVVEHGLFMAAAFLFWNVVIQAGYAPRPVPYPARMLFLFLAIPQGAFLGFALNATRQVLYPHYAAALGAAALIDQHDGADVMWILGGFLLFAAFMCTAGAWAAAERAPSGAQ